MLDGYMKNIADHVARDYDTLIESCFSCLGFDRKYIIQHEDEFRLEIYPERRVFYHNDKPLFAVAQTVDTNFETCRMTVVHDVEWFVKKEEAK